MLKLHSRPAVSPVEQVWTPEVILDLQRHLGDVYGDDSLLDYIVQLALASRSHPDVSLGASPRASLCLLQLVPVARAALDASGTTSRMRTFTPSRRACWGIA